MSQRTCPICDEPLIRYDGSWICDECSELAMPVSRQPECPVCQCESHLLRCEMPVGDALCPCPPRLATGEYVNLPASPDASEGMP